MSEQRHVIKRQTIELRVHSQKQAQTVQAEVSRVYRERIIPLVEQYCNELSQPDRIHRIELIDLDIGTLDQENLEEDLVSKLAPALHKELAAQIGAQEAHAGSIGRSPRTLSQLELFLYYAHTGSLPWWVDTSRPQLLQENLEQLLKTAPDTLRRPFGELTHEPQPRQRLVLSYTDAQLAELCSLLLPADGQAILRDVQALISLLSNTGGSGTRLRQVIWNNILDVAGQGGPQYDGAAAFYRAALQRVAVDLGSSWNALLVEIRRHIDTNEPHAGDRLFRALLETSSLPGHLSAPDDPAGKINRRLFNLRSAGGPLVGVWAELQTLLPGLPATCQERWLAVLTTDVAAEATAPATARRALQKLRSDPEPLGLTANDAARLAQSLRTALDAPNRDDQTLDLRFSASDALAVDNAGLVILWPFLGHFFDRLALLREDRRFKDLAAQQRATGLLQVLAAQDPAPAPEYLLPLNKLLCGLELTEVFDFGAALLETEAQECAGLLEAVIAQAPILHTMSADGFRGSFLLRQGLLSAIDGIWVLRVERQTYDVVLERFPWNWEWVRLPWMEAPLRVEW